MKDRQKYRNIRHIYIPLRRKYKSRQGLSERRIKKRLEKKGWEIWRGGFIHCIRYKDLYPNVFRKYIRLRKILGNDLEYLQYLSVVHHGMPDFFCRRKKKLKFVECKLGHEQLSERQKKCFPKLMELGYKVEVHKLVFPCTKLRIADVDLKTGEKIIREKQMRLKLHY
jgi:hypothetical protein